ncbi:MAG TPA: S41 family peptidase, partial [Solirubrobacterales bacterium]|nr:S41 family peptidase [Solirubrobacterales bacterium]
MSARGAVALAVALVALFAAGLWLGGHPRNLPEPLRDVFVAEPSGLVAEAAEAIEGNYYRPVGEQELGNSSLQGMVRELRKRNEEDRYSEYFSKEALESFNQEIEGRFSGIGLSVIGVKQGLRVAQVFKRSPADAAGIEPGDTIVAVEGESIAGQSSDEATKKIKGPEGSEVTIGVRDGKSGKVRQLTITRAEVSLPNVSSRVKSVKGRKLGYVRLLSFSEGAHAQLANAVKKVEKEGAEGIVLDLRHNPGGLLDEAVLCAGLFLPEDETVVITKSRTQGESVHKTSAGQITDLPVVVLIDGGSASAAEILAAALADDEGATTVGTRSYGKGLFQEEQELSNGGALKLSVGAFYTPKGVNLATSHGIHPDVQVKDDLQTPADEAEQRALGVLAG